MTLWKWSRTAASNSTADSTVNLREGQSAGSLNDSVRGLMAAVAKYRDDMAGGIATGGSSTAYTVTSYQGLTSLTDGFAIAFVPHATNGASPTLNVDSLGAKALRGVTGEALSAGVLVSGTPYVARYKSSTTEWLLHGFFGALATSVPLGMMFPYPSLTAPTSNFSLAYGQAISRTTYSNLFTLIGTSFGSGNGSTTFNIPDLRGRNIAGHDSMGGSAAGRITQIAGVGGAGGAEYHTLTSSELPASISHSLSGSVSGTFSGSGTGTSDAGDIQRNTSGTTLNGAGGTAVPIASPNAIAVSVNVSGSITGSASISGTIGGSGSQHNNLPPTILMPMMMRIL